GPEEARVQAEGGHVTTGTVQPIPPVGAEELLCAVVDEHPAEDEPYHEQDEVQDAAVGIQFGDLLAKGEGIRCLRRLAGGGSHGAGLRTSHGDPGATTGADDDRAGPGVTAGRKIGQAQACSGAARKQPGGSQADAKQDDGEPWRENGRVGYLVEGSEYCASGD